MRNKKILKELHDILENKFPETVDKIILYGSRARGNADKFSDYDILLILNKNIDWRLENEIQDVCWEIDYKYNILTDVKMIYKDDLNQIKGKQPYILNALTEGISI
jgi:predicted nucleotidyltransferase